jgi:ABC-type lipoprotein release transport system permease subunit
MKIYFLLAIRNLRRNLRRTVLTILGMAGGFAVLLWLTCVLKGTNQQIIDDVTSTQVGHLQIWRSDYLQEPVINSTFQPAAGTLEKLIPSGALTAERVFLPSLISSGEQSAPIMLTGVEPRAEAGITNIKSHLVEGEYLSDATGGDCQERQIYLGKSLASLLKVGLGDKVVILAQASDGTLGNELLRVRGLFDTGSNAFDRSTAFSSLGCVRKIGVINGDHEIAVRLPRIQDLNAVNRSLTAGLATVADRLKTTTWKEAVPSLAGMVTFNEATLLLISLVLFGVTAFGVVNTLLMSVFERTREFGVMLALGVTPSGVHILIITEAALIGLLAAVLGTLIGSVWVAYHQWVGFDLKPFLGDSFAVNQFKLGTVVYPVFSTERYFILVGATLVFATLAGLIPAVYAGRMKVIEAIRHR